MRGFSPWMTAISAIAALSPIPVPPQMRGPVPYGPNDRSRREEHHRLASRADRRALMRFLGQGPFGRAARRRAIAAQVAWKAAVQDMADNDCGCAR